MGTKATTKRVKREKREKQLRKHQQVFERAVTEATANVDALEVGFESTLRDLVAEAETRLRAAMEHVEVERAALEDARTQVTTSAGDLAAHIRTQNARLDRCVDAEVAHLAERARRATDEQLAAVERRLTELDVARADALALLEARAALAEQHVVDVSEQIAARMRDAAPPAPVVELEAADDDTSREPAEPVEPAEPAEPSEPSEPVVWATTTASSEPPAPEPAPITTPIALPAATTVTIPEPAPATIPETAPVTAPVATMAPSHPVTFETSRALLLASLSELRRAAADGWVRVEVAHRASQGQAVASLRLTVHDIFGGREYHDVPGRVSAGPRRATTVDAAELLHAIEVDDPDGSSTAVVLDGDITVGTVLVLGRDELLPTIQGERRKIERVEIPLAGRDALQLDTLAGRFVVPSRVASSLRSRRAHDVDLIMVGEQACLSARVPGPSTDVIATVETPLYDDPADAHASAADRRELSGSAVDQLVRALSVGSSPEELVSIATDGVGYARRRAAAHPALPADVIVCILTDGTESMRSAAAANPSIPPAAIERAVTDSAPAVRAAVAVNPRVPPAQLFALGRDGSAEVRVCVARNRSLSPEMLALLAGDRDAKVRSTVAAHPACPVDVLVQLANDQFPGVCARVAENPNCPVETLEQLLSIVPEVVLSNPRAPEHVLVAGSQVASKRLRAAVAGNPSTPARELQALARDADRDVVRALAANPHAPAGARRRARRRSERAATTKRTNGAA
jgi:hypothetical protein